MSSLGYNGRGGATPTASQLGSSVEGQGSAAPPSSQLSGGGGSSYVGMVSQTQVPRTQHLGHLSSGSTHAVAGGSHVTHSPSMLPASGAPPASMSPAVSVQSQVNTSLVGSGGQLTRLQHPPSHSSAVHQASQIPQHHVHQSAMQHVHQSSMSMAHSSHTTPAQPSVLGAPAHPASQISLQSSSVAQRSHITIPSQVQTSQVQTMRPQHPLPGQ